MQDLPNADSPDFAPLLCELGFVSPLERLKIAKLRGTCANQRAGATVEFSVGVAEFSTKSVDQVSCQDPLDDLAVCLQQRLLTEGLQLRDLPDATASDFHGVLQELGFSRPLERLKIGKLRNGLTAEPAAQAQLVPTVTAAQGSASRGDSGGDMNQEIECAPASPGAGEYHNSLFDTQTSQQSTGSAFDTIDYEEMSKAQQHEARHLVKDFVKAMVRGRHIAVVDASGQKRNCFCSLSKRIDRLKVSSGPKDRKPREIQLSGISDLVNDSADIDASAEGLVTSSVTLWLDTRESFIFHFPTSAERDEFATCLAMFAKRARQLDACSVELV